jgi:hypothetical protein
VDGDDRFEIVAPHPLSLVCFRLRDTDAANEQVLRRVNATGRAFLTHTKVDGRYTMRLAVGAPATQERHVAATWDLIRECLGRQPAQRSEAGGQAADKNNTGRQPAQRSEAGGQAADKNNTGRQPAQRSEAGGQAAGMQSNVSTGD